MRNFDPRRVINLATIVLAIIVLLLAGKAGVSAWEDYGLTRDVAQAHTMMDTFIEAAGVHAYERTITATALGRANGARSVINQIPALRDKGDQAWARAMNLARAMMADLPASLEMKDKLERADAAYGHLMAARATVDRCLDNLNAPCNVTSDAWIQVSSEFIYRTSLVRESAFLALGERATHLQLYPVLKRTIWLAREYLGRERGLIAYHVGIHRPIDTPTLDELKAIRGVVERNVQDILELREVSTTDPRIIAAINHFQDNLAAYDRARLVVAGQAATGHYPLDIEAWLDTSGKAVDSCLDVATAVTTVTNEYSLSMLWRNRLNVAWNGFLMLLSGVLALISYLRVRQTTNALYQQKELAEVTLHSIGDAVITTDALANVKYLNPVAERMTGWQTKEASGRPLTDIFRIVDGETNQPQANPIEDCLRENRVVMVENNTILLSRSGKEFIIEDSAAPIRDREGHVVGAVLVFYDVSQTRYAFHLVSYHASHDALTNLPNRREFSRRLQQVLIRAKNLNEEHAVCYLDVDQFKVINDTYGHAAGDTMLRSLADILRKKLREADVLARIGGDEFGIILEHCDIDHAGGVVEELRKTVESFRFTWKDHVFDMQASIGLVPINAKSPSPAEILSEADAACFVAKQKGRNRVQAYLSDDMEMALHHGEMRWVQRIKKALEENRFVLYGQTIHPLQEDGHPHVEVLIRMLDENGQLVAPNTFIPAAERYDLMPAIDRWVIRESIIHLARRIDDIPPGRKGVLAINLSGASLGINGLDDYIRDELLRHQIPPELLSFEITETSAVANLGEAAELIRSLKAMGCRFALDDFGSGLSSFMYLKTLPVDFLKIDGGIVRGLIEDPVSDAMVQSIHTVGQVMGIATIAEYVENEAIMSRLRQLGVDYGQGYAIARPHPLEEVKLA